MPLFHRIRLENVHHHEATKSITLNTRLDLRLVFSLKIENYAKILISPGFRFRNLPKHVCVLGSKKLTKSVLSYSWNNIDNRFCEIHAKLLNPMW